MGVLRPPGGQIFASKNVRAVVGQQMQIEGSGRFSYRGAP